jgi:hypothetical protein
MIGRVDVPVKVPVIIGPVRVVIHHDLFGPHGRPKYCRISGQIMERLARSTHQAVEHGKKNRSRSVHSCS